MLNLVNRLGGSKKNSKLVLPSDAKKLLIVGNGMVGLHFLKQLVYYGLHNTLDVNVVGDELVPAYNRIKLGEYVEHREVKQLLLESTEWYSEHGISLKLGLKVALLNREDQYVELENGDHEHYDLLVLATGSRPTVPSIPGADLPNVLTYRNIADLKRIIVEFESAKDVAVIGGGLLGIEAAETFQKLDVKTTIIQRANFLMTRQLNGEAADVLQKQIVRSGIDVYTQAQKTSIEPDGDSYILRINDSTAIKADYVLISAGITPNTEFAAEAGIECGIHGGCTVNRQLQTNDPNVFAIGECARFDGKVYGLAAPGFEMAEHLAALMAFKKKKSLRALDTSTRLKMSGVDVSVVGESLENGTQIVYQEDNIYRMITVNIRKRIVGAIAVGEWNEYADIHHLYLSRAKLSRKQIVAFKEKGQLFQDQVASNPLGWQDSRLVCNCMSVTKGEVMAAVEEYGNDPDAVSLATKASTVCGSCDYLVKGLCGIVQSPAAKPRVPKALLVTSVLALLVVLGAFILPPAPIADSVTSFWAKVDQIWRDNLIKQISGYTILVVFTLGLLVSLRKRMPWFNFGKYVKWRYFHVAFGLLSLIVLYAHTGFHFGHNLNFWLMLVFTLLNLFGAVTGVIMALENTSNVAVARFSQLIRPYMLWGHILLFWPLPILVTFHILSVYQY